MNAPRPLRRRLVALLGLVLATLVVLPLLGVQVLPTRWLVAAWTFDILLGLVGMPGPLARAARMELRLYEAIGRAARRRP